MYAWLSCNLPLPTTASPCFQINRISPLSFLFVNCSDLCLMCASFHYGHIKFFRFCMKNLHGFGDYGVPNECCYCNLLSKVKLFRYELPNFVKEVHNVHTLPLLNFRIEGFCQIVVHIIYFTYFIEESLDP